MRNITICAGIIASLLAATPASAQSRPGYLSGNDFFAYCYDGPRSDDFEWCAGYAGGAFEASYLTTMMWVARKYPDISSDEELVNRTLDEMTICPPPGITHWQIAEVAITYMRENITTRQDPAGFLIIRAMGGAFPCWNTSAPELQDLQPSPEQLNGDHDELE